VVNEKEYQEWRTLPATKSFFEYAQLRYEGMKENWALGVYDGEDVGQFALNQAQAWGGAKIWREITELTYEDIESDEEFIGDTPA